MTLLGYRYICSAGETFDSVALQVYGDEKYAEELLCANVELCHKLVFTGKEVLNLPDIDIPKDMDGNQIPTAPWKE